MNAERLTYGSYLRVDELLSLQRPRSDPAHHDELLFIVIHQVYELWFRLVLHEIETAIRALDAGDLLKLHKHFHRIHVIQRLLEEQVDVLETMTPQDFNAFRSRLNPASGFQSLQFREIEALCGAPANESLRFLELAPADAARLERRRIEPTLYDALKGLLQRRGFAAGDSSALVGAFRAIYENETDNYDLHLLLEDFIEFDERFLLWRGRHVRMVERMIGMKMGTGGSLGARYLHTTLERRFFPELWEVRTYLGAGDAAPG
ncbi:MAG: tryptophan 2,3-dioxygenase [Candidatus Velthaea sp.]